LAAPSGPSVPKITNFTVTLSSICFYEMALVSFLGQKEQWR
jgi:hypothetical protein